MNTHQACFPPILLAACAAISQLHAGTNPDALNDLAADHSTATGLLVGKLTGETTMDRLWSAATLYKDDTNPILQEFALQGMGQFQYAEVHDYDQVYSMADIRASKGTAGHENYWGDEVEVRRLRLGIKSRWFNQFKLDGNLDLDPNFDYRAGDPDLIHGFAKQILDLYVSYAPNDAFNLMIGKREVKFGKEQEISSKEILTFERSLLSNALYPGELSGVWVAGKGLGGHWGYEAGLYSTERSPGIEFYHSDAGKYFLGKLSYDYSEAAGLDSATAGLHYFHNSEPGDISGRGNGGSGWPNTSARRSPYFSDGVSVYNDLTWGRFGLTTELLYGFGHGGGQSDVYGVTFIPSYFIADGLQLVGRFHWASSADANDLALPSRYEAIIPGDDRGDRYWSAYLGLNYYIYGHKLKLMTGIEYAHMNGNGQSGHYDGYTFLTGLRYSF